MCQGLRMRIVHVFVNLTSLCGVLSTCWVLSVSDDEQEEWPGLNCTGIEPQALLVKCCVCTADGSNFSRLALAKGEVVLC
ncbi:hypothetical protein COO60DRAFT_822302 [Scenedesmus sp. NREL 46B-D3]|nr:hypothetical protein COO60DRAFT_822302 [Scenedesmus sp. NREL 46B-D3]